MTVLYTACEYALQLQEILTKPGRAPLSNIRVCSLCIT
jgi:hypothetical protein